MTEPTRQGSSGDNGQVSGPAIRDEDLERRRRELDAKLASRRAEEAHREKPRPDNSGFGQALKLSGEFIAGIVVGAGLGWFIDQYAGTTPWGMIVFLLLGFGAGVLNVLRSAGLVAEAGIRSESEDKTGE